MGEGNFKRLLRFRVQAGDTNLEDQIKTAPLNACYTSGDIQNQVIKCIGSELRDKVISRVKKSGFYVIMADETTDISSTEQLSLCLRYYDQEKKAICEDFISFIDVLNEAYDHSSQEVHASEESIPKTMEEYLERCEEENQKAFEIEEPKLTGEVIRKAIVTEIENCCTKL